MSVYTITSAPCRAMQSACLCTVISVWYIRAVFSIYAGLEYYCRDYFSCSTYYDIRLFASKLEKCRHVCIVDVIKYLFVGTDLLWQYCQVTSSRITKKAGCESLFCSDVIVSVMFSGVRQTTLFISTYAPPLISLHSLHSLTDWQGRQTAVTVSNFTCLAQRRCQHNSLLC